MDKIMAVNIVMEPSLANVLQQVSDKTGVSHNALVRYAIIKLFATDVKELGTKRQQEFKMVSAVLDGKQKTIGF